MHQANLVFGGKEAFCQIKSRLEASGYSVLGNPDFLVIDVVNFGIDDSRFFEEWAKLKPVGDRKVCVIVTSSMTVESQNALLKEVEEIRSWTYLYIIIKNQKFILPTLRSRMITHDLVAAPTKSDFWDKDMKSRLEIIRDKKNLDKESLPNLIEEAELYFKEKKDRNYKELEKIMLGLKYALQKGVSHKMILEWLAYYL